MSKYICLDNNDDFISNDSLIAFTIKILQPVLDSLSSMQNIWLKFIDHSGQYIATTQARQQCSLCRYIRSTYWGNKRCRGSARQVVFSGRDANRPGFFECHAGLTLISVPIRVAGLHLGALAFGEIVEKPKPYVLERISDLGLNNQTLSDLYDEIPVLSHERVSMLAKSLHNISNCFIQMGVALAGADKSELKRNAFSFLSEHMDSPNTSTDELVNYPVGDDDIPSPQMQKLINNAEQYIISNYDQPITLKDVADFIHINPTYFSHLFKQVKGYTFKGYLTHLRIENAKQLLLNSSLTVSEISQRVGYDDSTYFSRVFKKVTGFPPSLYRK